MTNHPAKGEIIHICRGANARFACLGRLNITVVLIQNSPMKLQRIHKSQRERMLKREHTHIHTYAVVFQLSMLTDRKFYSWNGALRFAPLSGDTAVGARVPRAPDWPKPLLILADCLLGFSVKFRMGNPPDRSRHPRETSISARAESLKVQSLAQPRSPEKATGMMQLQSWNEFF